MSINNQFAILVVYYWILRNFTNYISDYGGFGTLKWFFLIIPVFLFILLNINGFLTIKYNKLSVVLLVYCLLVGIFAILRQDVRTFFYVIIWSLPLIIVVNRKVYLNYKIVNLLFIFSIIISIISYYKGINLYGFLPGQAKVNLHQGLVWRISIWPYSTPPYSAVFAFIVILINYFYNKNKTKYLFIFLGLYFLIFSGSRTTMLSLLIIISFMMFTRIIYFKKRIFYKLFPLIIIILYVCIVISPSIILYFGLFNNEFINTLIFRSIDNINLEDLKNNLVRSMIWRQHLSIFAISPIIGVGNYYLTDYYPDVLYYGSDSLLTALIARDGLLILPFIFFFYFLYIKAMNESNKFLYCLSIMFSIFLITYSGFFYTWDVMFLTLIGFINANEMYPVTRTKIEVLR